VDDAMKKLGYRVRPRTGDKPRAAKPGHIAFDDRGNAVYEWNDDPSLGEGAAKERRRKKALDHPGLSLVDDEPPANAPIRVNPKGSRQGYNPYESGILKKKGNSKRDLRELSKWIDARRKMDQKTK
jgi:hypothetical protein